MSDYFLRCKKRIMESEGIRYNFTHYITSDDKLKITVPQQGVIYDGYKSNSPITFNDVEVPLDIDECNTLLDLCRKIYKEQKEKRDNKVLEKL